MRNLNCKTFDIDIGNGEKLTCAFMLAKYIDNKFPFLGIVIKENGTFDFEEYGALSVNVGKLPRLKVEDGNFLICVDRNNFPFAEKLLLSNFFARHTERFESSGFCQYPVFEIRYDKIRPYVVEDIRDEY